MADPVVITRPQAQAGALADKVSALGREAVLFPLLDIEPIPDPAALKAAFARIGDYAMIAFVSPNAIDCAFRHAPPWPRELLFAVVGEGSRLALARHGITPETARIVSPVDPERTDSETLLAVLDLDALRGRRALIVRGEAGRELLADALRSAGVAVEQVAAYRRAAPVLDDVRRTRLQSLLDGGAEWIVTSSEALRHLVDMARACAGADGVAKLQQQHVVVPHVRIEETAHDLGFRQVTRTGSGDDRVLAALQSRA